ncbi:U11/U12 small nuclear ribonucleoprotein 35 kDa protein-like [Lineus longissimus]|uniref:U11/U12 small nuclear ribonucleoprotein 35 kDa protein-like n=1 Tax=Lineus longissimus TaxID=88925 RepID=UPI00315D05A4
MTSLEKWSSVLKVYDPLKAGSIDGTDTAAHDHGIIRALNAKYRPNKYLESEENVTLFVGRLNPKTSESDLEELFSRFGEIRSLKLIRDIVTGFSKRYAFIEYEDEVSACRAVREAKNRVVLHHSEILVDFECGRKLPGWVPRRLGGGFGGKKESGQLRFGGIDRPHKKPFLVEQAEALAHALSDRERLERNERARGSYGNMRSGDKGYPRESRGRSDYRYNRRQSHSQSRDRDNKFRPERRFDSSRRRDRSRTPSRRRDRSRSQSRRRDRSRSQSRQRDRSRSQSRRRDRSRSQSRRRHRSRSQSRRRDRSRSKSR